MDERKPVDIGILRENADIFFTDTPRMDDLEFLERSCTMFILRYLRRHPGANQSEVMSTEGKKLSTKNRRLSDMVMWDLLEIYPDEFNNMRYELTTKGEFVAFLLDMIAEILMEQAKGMNEDETQWISPVFEEYLKEKEKQKANQGMINLDE